MANTAFNHDPALTVAASNTTAGAAVKWVASKNLGESLIILDSGGNGRIGLAGDLDLITLTANTVTVAGTVAATAITGVDSVTFDEISHPAYPSNGRGIMYSTSDGDLWWQSNVGGSNTRIQLNTVASGTTINTNADNRVITGSGDANTLNGETGLTFNAGVLTVDSGATNVSAIVSIEVDASATSDPMLRWREGSGNGDANNQQYEAWMDVENGQFRFRSQNINGSSQEGDIWTVNDGTDDVKFNGNLGIGNAPAGDAKLYVTQGSAGNWVLKLDYTGGSGGHGILMRWTAHTADDNSAGAFHYEDSTALRFRVYSDGDVQNHDNSYGSTSDRRLKENIVDARPALPELEKLRMREFSWISDGLDTADLCGVVAQEVLEAGGYYGGHFIKENGEGYYSAYYSQLVPMLVKAVQELNAKIEALGS